MSFIWDEKLAREFLPTVSVKLPNGRILQGQVRGRWAPYACVGIVYDKILFDYSFSWRAIVNSLNKGTHLLT